MTQLFDFGIARVVDNDDGTRTVFWRTSVHRSIRYGIPHIETMTYAETNHRQD